MTSTTTLPAPADVAEVAARVHAAILADPEYPRLIDGCGRYNSDWTCTTGTLAIAHWNQATDAVPLLGEALKVLALKAAVYELTGDEVAAELPVAAAVDEVLHAVLAQRGLTERMAGRCDFQVVHMTDTEQDADAYEAGGYTWQVYLEAFGAVPPPRYWIGGGEQTRRVATLTGLLGQVGLLDRGRRHDLDFTTSAG